MSAPSLEELLSGVRKGEAEEATAAGSGELKEKPVAAAAAGNAAGGQEEEENLEDVEETVMERLVGLTEMVPERLWNTGEKGLWFSVWLVQRTAWVLGTSLALLALPPFIEQQRFEYEEMQNMQKKQLMLGQGAPAAFPPTSPR